MEKIVPSIHCKTLIRASSDKIFPFISTGKGWDSWFTHGTVFELEKSGKILFSWRNWGADKVTTTAKGEVVSFKKNHFVRFHWNFHLSDGPTIVELKLTPNGNETLFEVVESNYHDTTEGLAMLMECSNGWGEAMTLLKVFIEHGITYH